MQVVDPLFARLARLHTALVSDVLDALGHRTGAMDFRIRALGRTRQVVGRAFTLASASVEEPERVPYEKLLAAYRHMSPRDVVVLATDGELQSGVWGELLSTAARARGALGAVTDGLTRDLEQIDLMGFAVFARGTSPTDSAGRQAVQAFGERIVCGGVDVHPGDVVFGDAAGVVVIPSALADEAVGLAEEKHRGESVVRAELERGDDPAEVFARYGIL
ncbi:MAG: RraA family protein [Actinobacteria bacterium]|nr:RraA family protein [Actinomycetota bacterium]